MIFTNTDHYVNTSSTIKKEKKKKTHFLISKGYNTLAFCFSLIYFNMAKA